MDYDEDYAYDEYVDNLLEELRTEHGREIAEEETANAILSEVLASHQIWWPQSQKALEKANKRLAEGEYAEAVFHIGRAFDGYFTNVLVLPLRGIFVEQFRRSLPTTFNVTHDKLFKSVSGLGSGMTFAAYTIALLASNPEDSETLINRLSALVQGGRGAPEWSMRDRSFHAPIDVDEGTALGLASAATALLEAVVVHAEGILQRQREAKERWEFSPARLRVLEFLAGAHRDDPERSFSDFDVMAGTRVPPNDFQPAITSLEQQGYVERTPGESVFHYGYRLSPEGDEYYRQVVMPRLAETNSASAS